MAEAHPLLEDPVGPTLWNQSVPMAVGVVFMIAVNLIDTYWASQLGTDELAAMSFAFPLIGVAINISLGLMIGTSVAIARVLGAGDSGAARRIAAHSIVLGLGIVLVVVGVGISTQSMVFSALGAPAELLPIIDAYMRIWYLGSVFLVVPMMLNGVLRAHGDALTPRNLMILTAIFNGILDPIFIYGLGPVPAMGLEGAALASAASRAITFVYAAQIAWRGSLLDLHMPTVAELLDSWKQVLQVGVPATLTNVLGPIATTLITAIVATFGPGAVAAYGIGARVEALVLIPPIALSSGLSPFVGQNWGAHLEARVREGFNISTRFCVLWGLGALVVLIPAAPWIAAVFTDDAVVAEDIVTYLRIVPIGYAAYGVMMMVSSSFNAMDHAMRSTVLSVLRSIVFAVPIAWVGGQYAGLTGVFAGLAVGSLLAALIGLRWMRMFLGPAQDIALPSQPFDGEAAFLIEGSGVEMRASMQTLVTTMQGLEDIELHRVVRDAVGFFVGHRQLGHIHPSGHLDMNLPRDIGELLVDRGILCHHRLHDDAGWYSHPLHDGREVDEALWLLELAHVLYESHKRGLDDALTQQELAVLDLDDELRTVVDTVCRRWAA